MATKQTLKSKLQKELAQLKELADKQSHMYVSSRNMLYEGLAKVYLWWQEANKEKGLLEKLYKDNGIQYKKEIKADENYSPLLRYLWGMDGTVNSNTIDLWNRALNKVNGAVNADKAFYKQNTVQKIITYIDTKGGIRGLAAYDSTQVDVAKEPKQKKAKVDLNVEKKRHEEHLAKGFAYYAKSATPISKFQSTHSLPTADSSIGLGLFRKTKNGYELLKAIDDKELIEQALISSYARSTDSVPYTVRLITEIISTQTVPKPLESLSRSLADKSKFKADDGTAMMMLKRLLYMAEKRVFVLSASRSTCSPVTIAIPKKQIIDGNKDVFLAINDRTYIEDNLIHSGDVNFYTTDAPTKVKAIKGEIATYKLELENTLTKKYRYIRFYPLTVPKTEASRQQAILKRGMKFKAVHTAKLDAKWLAELNGEFLSRWVNGLGKNIKRKEYAVIALAFGKTGITFKFCQRANRYTREEFIRYTHASNTKAITVEVLAKDVIPVLNSFVNSDLVGGVTVETDDNAVIFKYKTKSADYIVAVPTTNSKGIRNEEHFQAYGA
ncbi:hypothetical protein [Polynucleobacter sp. MWH-Berg-3C6]|uniref:hypothetical protein n=1 Tax=Polynucleobacter sp. MWH-Berg-3C6 TaxID=1855882 RepID=UPI001C0C5347|nr:hypothetical protein [Polynucleobacter sp. MWH-Berg-3C6]MBU3551183.1 hypothetical protein [Polynucleobacter sp. MWH-Berg-3C6]